MSDNTTDTDVLIQYLDGELEGERLTALQEKMATDSQLAAELENLRLTKAAIKSYGLQRTVSTVHQQMMKELGGSSAAPVIGIKRILTYSYRIAAIVLVLVGSTFLFQYFTATPAQLFRNNFEAFNVHETRGTNDHSALEEAYKNGHPADVIQKFKQLPAPKPADYFLNGNACLAISNTGAAIASFLALQQQNKTSNTHFFEEDTEYYLALAYLNNNQPAKALPLFEKIYADGTHTYNSKVTGWFMRKLRRLAKAN